MRSFLTADGKARAGALTSRILRLAGIGGLLAALVIGSGAGCGKKKGLESRILDDETLYQMALEAMEKKRYEKAREHLSELVAVYPESPHFYDAKLGIADSYFRTRAKANYYEAIALYESFVSYYPQHERVCYARYQIARSYVELMEKPDRDQKATRQAVDELTRLVNLCPDSEYAAEVDELVVRCNENLAGHEFAIGHYYFRSRAYAAAEHRMKKILRERQYEQFSQMPSVYFYLAEALRRSGNLEESRIYFQQLLEKFPDSKHEKKARKRLARIEETLGEPAVDTSAGDQLD